MLFPLQNETECKVRLVNRGEDPYLPISLCTCAVEDSAAEDGAAEEVALQRPSAVTKSDPLRRLLDH